jgi:hypothetical protein
VLTTGQHHHHSPPNIIPLGESRPGALRGSWGMGLGSLGGFGGGGRFLSFLGITNPAASMHNQPFERRPPEEVSPGGPFLPKCSYSLHAPISVGRTICRTKPLSMHNSRDTRCEPGSPPTHPWSCAARSASPPLSPLICLLSNLVRHRFTHKDHKSRTAVMTVVGHPTHPCWIFARFVARLPPAARPRLAASQPGTWRTRRPCSMTPSPSPSGPAASPGAGIGIMTTTLRPTSDELR